MTQSMDFPVFGATWAFHDYVHSIRPYASAASSKLSVVLIL